MGSSQGGRGGPRFQEALLIDQLQVRDMMSLVDSTGIAHVGETGMMKFEGPDEDEVRRRWNDFITRQLKATGQGHSGHPDYLPYPTQGI